MPKQDVKPKRGGEGQVMLGSAAQYLCASNTVIFSILDRHSFAKKAEWMVTVLSAVRTWLSEIRDLRHKCCIGHKRLILLSSARPFNFHASVSPLLNVTQTQFLSIDQTWGRYLGWFGPCAPGESPPDLFQGLKFICSIKLPILHQKFLSGWHSANDSLWSMCAVGLQVKLFILGVKLMRTAG